MCKPHTDTKSENKGRSPQLRGETLHPAQKQITMSDTWAPFTPRRSFSCFLSAPWTKFIHFSLFQCGLSLSTCTVGTRLRLIQNHFTKENPEGRRGGDAFSTCGCILSPQLVLRGLHLHLGNCD